ncbi:MAG TPA: S8 family serine peptidase [Thermoanaerobaculia bacterium]|jgi:hypothetical protein|nr:S8 family serine peptidase [Thermoanaerobaculia bacterium]
MSEHIHTPPIASPPKHQPRVIFWPKNPTTEEASPIPANEAAGLALPGAIESVSPKTDALEKMAKHFPNTRHSTAPNLLAADRGAAVTEIDFAGTKVSFLDVGSEDPQAIAAFFRGEGMSAFVEGPPTNPPYSEEIAAQDKAAAQLAKSEATARKAVKKRIAGLSQPQQGYLDPAPLGINARYAWTSSASGNGDNGGNSNSNRKNEERRESSEASQGKTWTGVRGQDVQLADIEQGWQLKHIEIGGRKISWLNENREFLGHGTAVLGIIAAENDGVQITGIAHGLETVLAVSQWNKDLYYSTACAIHEAAGRLLEGDILLIEAQTVELGGSVLLPVEIEEPVFHAIDAAVKKGIVVIEAAGNGGFDLDNWYDINGQQPLRRRAPGFLDSGAIMVGASLPPHHALAPFSNRGSRIDCFAWGRRVYTAGDGFRGRSNSDYTADFTGTSAAAAIVAGAAALVQSLAKSQRRAPFNSKTMRSLLANPTYGTLSADPPNDQIGVMPDLKRIFTALGVPVPAP